MPKIRMEISSIDEKLAKKIRKYCIDKSSKKNDYTLGHWAQDAHNALTSK